jgi:hypothetical protein
MHKTTTTVVYSAASVIVGALVTMIGIPLCLLRGFVFMKLWNWFVFGSLSNYNMGWIIASGIAMIIGWTTAQTLPIKDQRTEKEKLLGFSADILAPFLILFFGWILHLFV